MFFNKKLWTICKSHTNYHYQKITMLMIMWSITIKSYKGYSPLNKILTIQI